MSFLLFSSCGTINFFTRLKKIPREYSLNYCGEEIKALETDLNKQVWIVFSDRENNSTYQNPGGKVKLKPVGFLDAFLVIKEKKDYLQLIKYDPEITGNNMLASRIKNKKKVEYYGWMHKSQLLLTRQSITDIATGFKNKQISIITDTTTLEKPYLFFADSRIRLFKDPDLRTDNGKMPLYSILYTLKTSEDKQKILVAKKTTISPDSTSSEILGWVHSSLVRDVSPRLFVDLKSISPDTLLEFQDKLQLNTFKLSSWNLDRGLHFGQLHPEVKYNPVLSYSRKPTSVNFKIGVLGQVVEQENNYVFNVNGNKIMYNRFKELEVELKKLNMLFVFEARESVIEKYNEIINAIQNLQPLFEKENDDFSYRFGAVVPVKGKNSGPAPNILTKGMSNSFTEILDFLISQADTTNKLQPLSPQNAWNCLRKGIHMIEPYKDETNVVVIIGEDGYSEWADSVLVRKMAAANCRILGYQFHSKTNNEGNNFVLQITNMIEHCASREAYFKREKIVYADQLRPMNNYKEKSKNIYALDFPDRSMTQGWILFPEKNKTLPLDILANSIDSLVTEVKWDNNNLINSLYKSFNTVGNHRHQYDSIFVKYNRMLPNKVLKKEFTKNFNQELPFWYLPSLKVNMPDSIDRELKYYLLLSKDELEELRQFISTLSANDVDYQYKGREKKTKKSCNCPDDDFFDHIDTKVDSVGGRKYMSTRNIRKKLQEFYYRELKSCKLCKISTSTIRQYSLAEAQRQITGCPSYSPILQMYLVGNIRQKNCLTDPELDALITYFKKKKEELDRYLISTEKFESNGQTYYWISQSLLP